MEVGILAPQMVSTDTVLGVASLLPSDGKSLTLHWTFSNSTPVGCRGCLINVGWEWLLCFLKWFPHTLQARGDHVTGQRDESLGSLTGLL